MKKIYGCLAILLLCNVQFAEAQEPEPVHFQPVYSGNPYLAMNFYLTAITIDDTTVEVGDEVGIFDGDICVGAGIVTGPLGEYLDLVAATDDPTTPEKDGFTPGNPISYRLWDASALLEIIQVDTIYASGKGFFQSQGTAVLELHGTKPGTEPSHFQPVYSGNPYLAMNFYLTDITIDELPVEIGDEIGIFDGDVCVGAGIVTGPLGQYLDLVAATDDPTTPEKDGFTPDNPISFRLWDYSAQIEVRNISSIYTSGEAVFSSQGTVVLEIHGNSAQPMIQIIAPVPDREVPEDTPDFDIADLDTVFSVTPEGSALEFTTTSDTTAISVRLDEFNVAWVSLAENWNGTGQIFLSTTLSDSTLSDTVLLTVTPVNDLPSPFELISPVDGWSGGATTLTFSWSASVDPDTDETPAYDFALSTDSSFAIVDTFINCGSDTTLAFDSLAPGKYYWKVSAYSGLDTVWGSESDQKPWSFTIIPVALESANPVITHYRLDNNYPNPFNPTTTIRYELPRQSRVMLSIYDINGRAVANLVNATQPTGLYSVTWDAGDLGSGVYFYRIEVYSPYKNGTGEFRQVKKMILIK